MVKNTISLDEKIAGAKEVLKRFYETNNGKIFVSFSGGKDSTVLLHIARELYPDLQAVYSNTTNEDKDVIAFVKKQDNIQWIVPEMSFKEVIVKHGFPLVSKEVSKKIEGYRRSTNVDVKKGLRDGGGSGWPIPMKWFSLTEEKFDVTSKCCDVLKKKPLGKWAKENDMKPLIGLMADESALRMQLALFGEESPDKGYPFLRTGWTEADIWAYSERFKIEFAECYYDRYLPDGSFLAAESRTGCIFCGFGIQFDQGERFEKQKIKNRKRYESMMALENNGVTFKDAINKVLDLSNEKVTQRKDFEKAYENIEITEDRISGVDGRINNTPKIEKGAPRKPKVEIVDFEKEFNELDALSNIGANKKRKFGSKAPKE